MENFVRHYVKVIYNTKTSCLEVTFTGFITYDELVETIKYEFEMIRHYKIKKCLVNLREISVYPEGGQEYIKNVWFPGVVKGGIEAVAFIVPDDVFGRMSMNEAHSFTQGAFTMTYDHFNDLKEANEWLNKQVFA